MLICLDASIFVKLVVSEHDSPRVRQLWAGWAEAGHDLVAPSLILYETVSILRKKVLRDFYTVAEAERALEYLMALRVNVLSSLPFHARALQLANELGRPNAYDAHYLALAEELDCELWTSDERLYNAVHDRFPLIRLPS